MKKFTALEALAHLALLAMALIWIGFGWHVLIEGVTYHTARGSRQVTAIDGAGAIAIAYIMLSLGSIAIAYLLGRLATPVYLRAVAAGAVLALPTFYLIAR